jgi:hypothetical protein
MFQPTDAAGTGTCPVVTPDPFVSRRLPGGAVSQPTDVSNGTTETGSVPTPPFAPRRLPEGVFQLPDVAPAAGCPPPPWARIRKSV